MSKPPFLDDPVVVKHRQPMPRLLSGTIKFAIPPDTRSDSEKACDEFLIWVNDLVMFGIDDAVSAWRSMTEKPVPDHPGDCAQCRERASQSPLAILFIRPSQDIDVNEVFPRAAAVAAEIRRIDAERAARRTTP